MGYLLLERWSSFCIYLYIYLSQRGDKDVGKGKLVVVAANLCSMSKGWYSRGTVDINPIFGNGSEKEFASGGYTKRYPKVAATHSGEIKQKWNTYARQCHVK